MRKTTTSMRFRPSRTLIFIMLVGITFSGALQPASAASGSVVYTYDALGRVATASYDTNVIVIYTYDANGNRLSEVVNVNTATLQWTATPTGACTANCWGAGLW